MSDPNSSLGVNPWGALWFHPRAAIDAVLARNLRATSLLIAVVGAFVAALSYAVQYRLFRYGGDARFVGVALGLLLGYVALASVSYYLNGWVFNGVARLLGGRGGAFGSRAALAWGSVPYLLFLLLMTAAYGVAEKAESTALTAVLGVASLISRIWWIVLSVAMLAQAQRFGAGRAFVSLSIGLVGWVGFSLALALALRSFAFQPFNIPSNSMTPTLQAGDYVFASKWPYGYSRYSFPLAWPAFDGRLGLRDARRGDVAVFREPNTDEDFVKRIIGLPGDKVQLKAARLYINGQIVERRAVEPGFAMKDPYGKPVVVQTYDEILPEGPAHRIIQRDGDQGPFSNTQVFETPPGAYFVMGDNRDNSMDSRMPAFGRNGFVPSENLIGRADFIYFSVGDDSAMVGRGSRVDRLGTLVR